jgi:TniQ protein
MIEVLTESFPFTGSSPVDEGLTLRCLDQPKADESFFGYLVRLAELNGYDNGLWLLQLTRATNSNYAMQSRAADFLKRLRLSSLSHMIAVPLEELQRLASRYAEHTNARRKLLHWLDIAPYALGRYAKICPDCLRESPHSRTVWDVPFVTGCLKHQRVLIDRCPQCGAGIRRLRAFVADCQCGMDWRKINRAVPLNERGDRLLKIVYAALEIHSGILCDPAVKRNSLYGDELGLMLERLMFIGSQFRSLSRIPSIKNLTNFQLHRWLVRAFSVFDDWPHRFQIFLDWKHKRSRALDAPSARPHQIKSCECKRDFYQTELPVEPEIVREMISPACFESATGGYMSVGKAREHLNLPVSTMFWYIDNRILWKEWLRDSKPWTAVVHIESVNKLKAILRTGLTRTEMAQSIGVTEEYVDDLVRSRCIVPFWTSEFEYVLARDAPFQLLTRMRQAVRKEYPQATEGDTATLQTILDRFGLQLQAGALNVSVLLSGFISDWVCDLCGGKVPRCPEIDIAKNKS